MITLIAAIIQTVGVLVAAYLAANRAAAQVNRQIAKHDDIAKAQTTWETILRHQLENPDWMDYAIAARRTARHYESGNSTIPEDLTTLPADEQIQIVKTIRFLNPYELIAHGLTQDTLDIDTYRHWCETGYRATYKDMQTFIHKWRDSRPSRQGGWSEFQYWADKAPAWTQESVRRRKDSVSTAGTGASSAAI